MLFTSFARSKLFLSGSKATDVVNDFVKARNKNYQTRCIFEEIQCVVLVLGLKSITASLLMTTSKFKLVSLDLFIHKHLNKMRSNPPI